MCGSATLTIVVSSTWISVADITANVIINRSLPVGSSSASPLGAGRGEGAVGVLLIARRHGDQDAAAHALEERGLVGLAPPAGERPARLVTDDDEVGADVLGGLADAVDGVAEFERAVRSDAAVAQPLHALVQEGLRAPLL